jgi:hypothetical protein
MKVKDFWNKFENLMIAVTFAEAGLAEEAARYVKPEIPAYQFIPPALRGLNIWFGTVIIEE